MRRAAGYRLRKGRVIDMISERDWCPKMHRATQDAESSDVCRGKTQPPLVARRERETLGHHPCVGRDARVRMYDALGRAGGATGGDDECITILEWHVRGVERLKMIRCISADELVGPERHGDLATNGGVHSLVQRKHCMARIPGPLHLRAKLLGRRKIDGNETRHNVTLGGGEDNALSCLVVTSARIWFAGARPRTLPAAVVPVVIGAAVASTSDGLDGSRYAVHGGLALVVSVALQVAVNYANDYSDGVRGTDAARQGPMRLVGSGAASASSVKRAAVVSFGVAGVAGLLLATLTSWWLIPLGAVSMLAGWTYTGGPKPYGYVGLGELFVFVFFGLVATAGTTYVIAERVDRLSLVSGAVAGFLAVALLVVNNLRDIDGDRASNKRTLAVRIGASRTRGLYGALYVLATGAMLLAMLDVRTAAIGVVGVLAALPAIATVRSARSAPELIAALGITARAQLVIGALYSVGLLIQ